MKRPHLSIIAAAVLSLKDLPAPAAPVPPGDVFGWGSNNQLQTSIPERTTNIVAIAAGDYHSVALTLDGRAVCWGDNAHGQVTGRPSTSSPTSTNGSPPGLADVIAIAAGGYHTMALRRDGTVIAWGDNVYGQTNVPSTLSGVVAIAAGGRHSLALKQDGRVVAWGNNSYGQCNIPANLNGIIAVTGGGDHTLLLRSDGTLVGLGGNGSGQRNVPAGLSNVVAIAAGGGHSLALKADGTVAVWGANSYGQTNAPADATNIVAISAGGLHSLALTADGTVLGWGYDNTGQATFPSGVTGVLAIAAGMEHGLSLLASTPNPCPSSLGLNNYPGITLTGTLGATYRIEFTTDLGSVAQWQPLTNVTLFAVPQTFVDWSAPSSPKRFYRAVSP